MNEKQRKFGSILKELRIQKNMTQDQLALRICKTPGTIAQFERGDIYPNYETLHAIINVLDADANLFFGKKTAEYPDEAVWIANIIAEMEFNDRETVSKFLKKLSWFLCKSPNNGNND